MMTDDQAIKHWMEATFKSKSLSMAESEKVIKDLMSDPDMIGLISNPIFLYELSKLHSEAAFLLWHLLWQKTLREWLGKQMPSLVLNNLQVISTHYFPFLSPEKALVLKNGKGFLLACHESAFKVIEKPMAFRFTPWKEVLLTGDEFLSYDQEVLNEIFSNQIVYVAAIVAGIKYKSYELSSSYASERVQGGRPIKDWTSIQSLLSELYLSIKTDEALMRSINTATALSILRGADHFVSSNMQILGGAGYMEDYVVERLYRECIFLKNWPKPHKQELMSHYQKQMQA